MNIVHFGIDHLRVNFPDKLFPKYFKDYFEGLSANSNFKEVEWHGNFMQVVFISTKQKHILNFSHKEVPVLCLEKITDSGIGRTCAYVLKFHSSYFQYPELRNIFREFMFSKYADKLSITRLDICVDVDLSVDEFFKEGFETQFKVKETRKFGKKIQTQYFGTRNATNKKHFIRVYNKLLDTERKAKFGLYLDYFAYENVTRIEVQINSQSCKAFGVNLGNIWDAEFLRTIYKSTCINKEGTYFKALDIPEFENLEIIRRKPPLRSEILDRLNYAKVMLGYAKNLKKVGFDPVEFLIKYLK